MFKKFVLFCCIAILASCASEEKTQEAPLTELPPVEETTNPNSEADVTPIPPADPVPATDTAPKAKKSTKSKKKAKAHKATKKSKKKAKKTTAPE